MPARYHPSSTHPGPLRLQLLTIGFCTDLAGEEKLRAAGVERVWRRGNGTEDLDDALYEFRGRGGCLAIVDDLRICGSSRREILAKVSEITCETRTKGAITIVNIDQPDMDTYKLVDQALGALHAAAPITSHRVARRRGSLGGKAKALAAELARALRIAPDIARRLCSSRLTWKEKSEILGMPISTVQRHYGAQAV